MAIFLLWILPGWQILESVLEENLVRREAATFKPAPPTGSLESGAGAMQAVVRRGRGAGRSNVSCKALLQPPAGSLRDRPLGRTALELVLLKRAAMVSVTF